MLAKFYYGAFREEEGKVLVSVPDVNICETFGNNWEETFENAIDAMAGCIKAGEGNVRKQSSMKEVQKMYPEAHIMAIPIDENVMRQYEPTVRCNVIFKADTLKKIDEYRAGRKWKRSYFLEEAAKAYIANDS